MCRSLRHYFFFFMETFMANKRKKIEEVILKTMSTVDPTGSNTKIYRKKFDNMSDTEFNNWMKRLSTDSEAHIFLTVVPYMNEPTLNTLEEAANLLGVKLHQYVYFRTDGAKEDPVRTRVKVPIGYWTTRRLQQILSKKTGTSTDVSKRNQITGQLSGDSAVGRIADEEVYALKAVQADNILKELMGARADNRDKRIGMYKEIEQNGFVRHAELRGDLKNQPSLNYLDVMFLASGVRSDLTNSNEFLRTTAEKIERQGSKGKASVDNALNYLKR
jgi:hypothetical protein